MHSARLANVLLIEDAVPDIELAVALMYLENVHFNLHNTRDGEEAIDFLSKRGQFQKTHTPDIILLDLGLPKKSGNEVLTFIKSTPKLSDIPIFILSASENLEEIQISQNLGAIAHIPKPLTYEKLQKALLNVHSLHFTNDGEKIYLCADESTTNNSVH